MSEAEQSYRQAVADHEAGRLEAAVDKYRRVLRAEPRHRLALPNLGAALCDLGHNEEGLLILEQVAGEARDWSASALYNLGVAQLAVSRFEEAVTNLELADSLEPGKATVQIKLAVALTGMGEFDRAQTLFSRVIEAQPDYGWAQDGMATLLEQRHHWREALDHRRAAVRALPGNTEAEIKLALSLLRFGHYEEAWPHFDLRLKSEVLKDVVGDRRIPVPDWDGGDLDGSEILVHGEQGLGDNIQFVRFAAGVAARGGLVTLACPRPLARLLATVPGVGGVLAPESIEPDARLEFEPDRFACQIAIMSLPRALNVTSGENSSRVPYVSVDPAAAAQWRAVLEGAAADTKVRIGVVWAGSPTHINDCHRSIPLGDLEPLFGLPGVAYFSLQVGEARRALGAADGTWPIHDFADRFADFHDTAALIQELDLVVTVDTAVAHVAGALGRPVWVLVPTVPDWRWLIDRDDSPWYPTMRLFRQRLDEDWSGVVGRVREALVDHFQS